MADWYYAKDGQQQGPVSAAQLRQLAQSGALLPTDMVFKEGGKEWIAASSIKDLFAGVGSSRSSVSAGPAAERPARAAGSLAFDERSGGDDDEEGVVRRPSRGSGSGTFLDILLFRRMIAPVFIMALFWLGVLGVIGWGLFTAGVSIYAAGGQGVIFAVLALMGIPFGMLAVRLYAELTILLFRMNETLTDIKNLLEKQNRSKS